MAKEWMNMLRAASAVAFFVGMMGLSACGLQLGEREGGTATPGSTITALNIITATPTSTFTVTPIPPTISSSPSVTATQTPTPEPSATPTPVTPTPEPKPYSIQIGSPKYVYAFAHAEEGCRWLGVAGQAFDARGVGVKDLAVLVTGNINGQPVEKVVMTEEQSVYGPGGFELFLTDQLPGSHATFEIQLYDLQSQPLSEPQFIRAPARCEQNVVLVNFQAAYSIHRVFLPVSWN